MKTIPAHVLILSIAVVLGGAFLCGCGKSNQDIGSSPATPPLLEAPRRPEPGRAPERPMPSNVNQGS